MTFLGYKILTKKYLFIDLGVLLLLIVLPLYLSSNETVHTLKRALLYSGFITPVISYLEIKKSHQLPFLDNLGISLVPVYAVLFLLKVIAALLISLYV